VSYSNAADTDSVRPILLSARARSSVIIAEGEVDDEVIAELIQNFVDCRRTSPRDHKIP